MAILYPRGAILLLRDIPDEVGGNPKSRPVVLYEPFDPSRDEYLFCVAISTRFPQALPTTSIVLPYQNRGGASCHTGLTEPSVANCLWRPVAVVGDVIRQLGGARAKQMVLLVKQLEILLPQRSGDIESMSPPFAPEGESLGFHVHGHEVPPDCERTEEVFGRGLFQRNGVRPTGGGGNSDRKPRPKSCPGSIRRVL